MKRGEVWWVDMPEPAGRRPAVLLSRDAAYRVRAAITVAPGEILNEFLKPLGLTATAIAKHKCWPRKRGRQVDPCRAEKESRELG
jgi:hypothetical protein